MLVVASSTVPMEPVEVVIELLLVTSCFDPAPCLSYRLVVLLVGLVGALCQVASRPTLP